MKLIKWNLHEDVEAYTTTRKLGDISLNNPNYLKVLENRQELASLLNTDLEHMVAPRQTHSTNFKTSLFNERWWYQYVKTNR